MIGFKSKINKYESQTNCTNTLYKFFQPDVEYVTKLNFYNPNHIESNTLYNLKKSSAIEKQKEENNTILRLRDSTLSYIKFVRDAKI
jgi:hypothetical protein